jgi:endonuclease III
MVRKAVANHQAVAHASSTLEKIRRVRAGEELTGEHKVFGAAYRLLDPNRTSPTVTRSGFRDFVHPWEDRLCTVRELARLQTFPDGYTFKGRRCDTYAKRRYVKQTQHEQLGNAVPPKLAHVLARAIRRQLIDGRDAGELDQRRAKFEQIFPVLDAAYPEDSLGNKRNPLDELVYIMLSRRTREQHYQPVYDQLARRFRPWQKVMQATDPELRSVLQALGLVNQRIRLLRAVLNTIKSDFGRVSLAAVRGMSFSRAYHYLRSLPGVNDKTAKCVMLYSLGLPALPVDTHTLRVSRRLGLLPATTSLFLAPSLLDPVVPREHRGRYHVLTLLHGRTVCTPTRPRCKVCPLHDRCSMADRANKPQVSLRG